MKKGIFGALQERKKRKKQKAKEVYPKGVYQKQEKYALDEFENQLKNKLNTRIIYQDLIPTKDKEAPLGTKENPKMMPAKFKMK